MIVSLGIKSFGLHKVSQGFRSLCGWPSMTGLPQVWGLVSGAWSNTVFFVGSETNQESTSSLAAPTPTPFGQICVTRDPRLQHKSGLEWYYISSFSSLSLSRYDSILIRMCFQTAIYYVWKERNERRHHKSWVPTTHLTRLIKKTIRSRIVSLRYRGAHKIEGLLRRWFEVRHNKCSALNS